MFKFFEKKICTVMILAAVFGCRTLQRSGEVDAGVGGRDLPPPLQSLDPNSNVEKSAGCAGQMQSTGVGSAVEDLAIQVGSAQRRYLRVMPKRLVQGKPLALVFWWHGAASSPELTRSIPNYNHSPELEKLTEGQVIWLHPRHLDGTSQTWDRSDNGRDFRFFDQLFAQVTADFCIDLKKVFTIGVSNGGTFANHLASVRMKEIRAVVAVAVPPMGGNWRKVVMPSMLVQDDRDNFGSAQQTIRKMAQDAGCTLKYSDTLTEQPARCLLVAGCQAKTPVAFCPWQVRPESNPHDWPRFDKADEQIWLFLSSLGGQAPPKPS